MNHYTTLDATTLSTAESYRILTGCIVPRPIAWITSQNVDGLVNAAPFSSYNYIAHSPAMLAVNIGSRNGELKDTARNILALGEFVVNVATEANLELMHACGEDYEADVSEIELLEIPTLASQFVRPPRIAVSPVQMECRLTQTVPLGRGLNTLYIAEIVAFHLSDEVFDGRHVDTEKIRPVARLGGPYYSGLGEILYRPMLQKPPSDKPAD